MENSHQRKTADGKFPSLMELMNSVKNGLEPQHYLAEPINAGRRTSLVPVITVSIRVTQNAVPPPG
jgi:hypothetical protein